VYEPKRPNLVATAFLTLWVAILSLPMLTGKWLGALGGDQNPAGYASRTWGAEWWHRLGHVPLWEPELFGGMPYVGAGHGDIFYPTSFLRLIFPVATVINFGFVLHFILAGLFTFWLLRRLHVSWTGSVIGALAYQLSGELASYPSPGHDGKLFAATALPLAFLALVMALRDKRWEGYPLLAVAVALSLLGHFQIAYYLLLAAGLFALYLTFEENTTEPLPRRLGRLAPALGMVLLGFGLAAIQLLPFFQYIPFSPRAQGYHGFEGSTSYAIPWNHVLEFFIKNFVGARETYWGSNGLKLHSEYLGLPVVALAALGAFAKERRRLLLWLGGIGLLFLLISLGAGTPFYRVFWAIMPMVRKTRAPGMAFFAVSFVVAVFAAVGTERLERKEGRGVLTPWLVTAGVVALLAVAGAFGAIARDLAAGVELATRIERVSAASANAPAILWGALGGAVALAATAAIANGCSDCNNSARNPPMNIDASACTRWIGRSGPNQRGPGVRWIRAPTLGPSGPATRPNSPSPNRRRTVSRPGTAITPFCARISAPLVLQELAVQGDHDAVAARVGASVHVDPEVDGAHDAVAELLVDEFLDGRAVDLKYLVETVDRRIGGHLRVQRATGRDLDQRGGLVSAQLQDARQGGRLIGAERVLAQERGRGPRERRVDGVGQLCPGQAESCLGGQDGVSGLLLSHHGPHRSRP